MAELDPETRERLHGLCRQITVAHELDPEIQEELYGHMEDKLRAYLSGEERLTEADAFVLVREHFGDAGTLKALLRNAHPLESSITLARRLSAAFVLYLMATVVVNLCVCGISILLAMTVKPNAWWPVYFQDWFLLGPLSVLEALALWLIFVRWQRGIDRGRRSWFQCGKPAHMAVVILFLLVILATIPKVWFLQANPQLNAVSLDGLRIVTYGAIAMLAIGGILQCMAWLWWSDGSPRSRKALLWGLSAWLACTFFLAATHRGWGTANLHFIEPGWVSPPWLLEKLGLLEKVANGHAWGPQQYGEHALAQGTVHGISWNWFYLIQGPEFIGDEFGYTLFATAIALGIYVISRWIMSQSHRTSLHA